MKKAFAILFALVGFNLSADERSIQDVAKCGVAIRAANRGFYEKVAINYLGPEATVDFVYIDGQTVDLPVKGMIFNFWDGPVLLNHGGQLTRLNETSGCFKEANIRDEDRETIKSRIESHLSGVSVLALVALQEKALKDRGFLVSASNIDVKHDNHTERDLMSLFRNCGKVYPKSVEALLKSAPRLRELTQK